MFKKLLKEFSEAAWRAEKLNRKVGETLVRTLKDIIPDIESVVGWQEAGVDCVALISPSRSAARWVEGLISLDDIIREEVLDPLAEEGIINITIECPFGVYLTPEEGRVVRERLRQLMGETEWQES